MILYRPPCPYVIIGADKYEICSGDTVTVLAATYRTFGSSEIHYQWYLNGNQLTGETQAKLIYSTFSEADKVQCYIKGANCGWIPSNVVAFTVHTKRTPTITIYWQKFDGTETALICAGTPLYYYSTREYGGSNPQFQWATNKSGSWMGISGETASTMKYIPVDAEEIRCYMQSDAWCVTTGTCVSNTLVMDITANLSVNVSLVQNPTGSTCAGTSKTYTASTTMGGVQSTRFFEWYINNVKQTAETGTTMTYTPSNGDAITVKLTSTEPCAINNPAYDQVRSIVIAKETVLIDVESAPKSVIEGEGWTCYVNNGQTIAFAVTNVEGVCGSETYQWYKNSTPVGSNQKTYTVTSANYSDRDRITCYVNSDCPCTYSNPVNSNTIDIVITGTTIPKSISIYSDKTTICSGTTVNFSSIQVGYSSPKYLWHVGTTHVGTGSTYSSSSLVNGSVIMCECTETGGTDLKTSNSITITVNSSVPSITIGQTPTSGICPNELVWFGITAYENLGTAPILSWQRDGGAGYVEVGTAPWYASYANDPVRNNDNIKLVISNINTSCSTSTSATSNIITVSGIVSAIEPTISIESNIDCVSTVFPLSFTATTTNGGSSPTYDWMYIYDGLTGWLHATSATTETWDAGMFFSGRTFAQVVCQFTSSISCADPNPIMSNFIHLPMCPCSQSANKLLNSGGSGSTETDWIHNVNPVEGLADNWTIPVVINYYSGYTGSGANVIPSIGNATSGFTDNYQKLICNIFPYTMTGLLSNNFTVSSGTMNYLLSVQYTSTTGLNVFAFYSNGDIEPLVALTGTPTNATVVTQTFTATNNNSGKRLQNILFGHSQTHGNFNFTFAVDKVYLWECPTEIINP